MPRLKEAGTTQLQLVVSGNLSAPVVPMTVFHEMLEMHIFIRNCLIFRMVRGLDEMNWQALFAGEPVYYPSLGLENKGLFSCSVGLPANISVLQSVLHTAAAVILLRCRPHHVFSPLKTLQ